MSDQPRKMRVNFGLHCIAKQLPVDFWPNMEIDVSADPRAIARRSLSYWYKEKEGHLVPLVDPDGDNLVPDEVVISTPQGKVLGRWTIVDEINARFEQGHLT